MATGTAKTTAMTTSAAMDARSSQAKSTATIATALISQESRNCKRGLMVLGLCRTLWTLKRALGSWGGGGALALDNESQFRLSSDPWVRSDRGRASCSEHLLE